MDEVDETRQNLLLTLLNPLAINNLDEAIYSYTYLWLFPFVKVRSTLKIEYTIQPCQMVYNWFIKSYPLISFCLRSTVIHLFIHKRRLFCKTKFAEKQISGKLGL